MFNETRWLGNLKPRPKQERAVVIYVHKSRTQSGRQEAARAQVAAAGCTDEYKIEIAVKERSESDHYRLFIVRK